MFSGTFGTEDFVHYWLRSTCSERGEEPELVVLEGAVSSNVSVIGQHMFEELFSTSGMYECYACHKFCSRMTKCERCFIRICSEQCRQACWPKHKIVCRQLGLIKNQHACSRKTRAYLRKMKVATTSGYGFTFVSAAQHQVQHAALQFHFGGRTTAVGTQKPETQ